eukprot:Colp12_sorted_trinity150504_noHs@25480
MGEWPKSKIMNALLGEAMDPLHEYKMLKTIGEGAFSKVKLAIHKESSKKVAIKLVQISRLKQSEATRRRQKEKLKMLINEENPAKRTMFANLGREARVMQRLDHPNICKLYQVIETEETLAFVMEYLPNGQLTDYLISKGGATETEVRAIFRQVLSAMDHCHQAGVVHRDLKLENILLGEDNRVVITDFGLGRTVQAEDLCASFCGTPHYVAPELTKAERPYVGPAVDVWALGVCLFVMISGQLPFSAKVLGALYKQIRSADYTRLDRISDELQDLFARIFVVDVNARITVAEMRHHPWVMMGYSEPPPQYPVHHQPKDDVINDLHARSIAYERNSLHFTFHSLSNPGALASTRGKYTSDSCLNLRGAEEEAEGRAELLDMRLSHPTLGKTAVMLAKEAQQCEQENKSADFVAKPPQTWGLPQSLKEAKSGDVMFSTPRRHTLANIATSASATSTTARLGSSRSLKDIFGALTLGKAP